MGKIKNFSEFINDSKELIVDVSNTEDLDFIILHYHL